MASSIGRQEVGARADFGEKDSEFNFKCIMFKVTATHQYGDVEQRTTMFFLLTFLPFNKYSNMADKLKFVNCITNSVSCFDLSIST